MRVSVIEPGLIASELGEHIPHAGTRERFAKMTALWTPLQPADLAAAAGLTDSKPLSRTE